MSRGTAQRPYFQSPTLLLSETRERPQRKERERRRKREERERGRRENVHHTAEIKIQGESWVLQKQGLGGAVRPGDH